MQELRKDLIDIRKKISELVPSANTYHTNYVNAKTAYKQAIAKAKIKAMQDAKSKEEKTPTMINAVAETDPVVMTAQKALDLAECFETASKMQLDAYEEQCKAIKKAMSTIETEMRVFAG